MSDGNLILNGKQSDLLALVMDAGDAGCIVYGKGPDTTIRALQRAGLVEVADRIQVAVMGNIEWRCRYRLTERGRAHFA